MNSTPKIFKDKLIKNYLSKFIRDNIPDFESKWNKVCRWRKSCLEGDLEHTKETQIQGAFLVQIFDEVLGYTTVTSKEGDYFNQKQEFNSTLDASEADGGLGFFSVKHNVNDVRVVIELKDARKDLDKKQHRSNHLTPVDQAFSYANKNGSKCGWVIVSNFIETRLYKSNSSLEYETFDIRNMDNEAEFLRFYFLLCKQHLICETGKSFIDELYQMNEEMGIDISNKFYKDYKRIRKDLYVSMKENNPDKDELLLFTKSQKLMDRFVFICFCEDCGLLPQQVYQRLVESANNSFNFYQTKLWDELKGLFASIDKGGNQPMKINKYNGGLFKSDDELDSLIVPNDVLEAFTQLSTYDFGSDLNVNILGQIFEQSISDVEEIKNEINGVESEGKGKQKDDGIFYTPYYVTRYIVEETVGAYLKTKKEELKTSLFSEGVFKTEIKKKSTGRKKTVEFNSWVEEIPEEHDNMTEDEQIYRDATIQLHLAYWNAYEDVLRNIKICDPACGSGAFLNQCFDYLHEEIIFVLDMKHLFSSGQINLFDIDKQILQNNLFGVDINPESVEITKLSLWLKTAKKDQTLASLDNNIKCGNSIVESPYVAGELAFNWQNEFPDVFAQGGFDIIVGNPPYGATVDVVQKEYINQRYTTSEGIFDTYKIFFELGINLLKSNGYLGYITPNTYFELKKSGKQLRQFLFTNTLLKIVEVYNVFPNAIVEPVISIYQKNQNENAKIEIILVPRNTSLTSTFIADGIRYYRNQNELKENSDYSFNYKTSNEDEEVIKAIKNIGVPLTTEYYVYNGAKPYCTGKGEPSQTKEMGKNRVYNGYIKTDDSWIPYMRGKCIQRFTNMWDGEFIKYGNNLAEPRSADIFFREKIFVRQTGDTIIANIDNGNVANNTLHVIFPKEDSLLSNKYLLGILNSKLMTWIYQIEHPTEVGKPMAEVKKAFVEALPIVKGTAEQIKSVEELTSGLLTMCQSKHDLRKRFLHYIASAYEPKKITEKLTTFDSMSFKDFVEELKRQKVKLTPNQQMELVTLYDEQREEIQRVSLQIASVQKSLDDLIFEIYHIPTDVAEQIRNNMQIVL